MSRDLFFRRTQIEIERSNRIKVAIYAYAYEFLDKPVVSDGFFDQFCKRIRQQMPTGNEIMDAFFRTEFQPFTGSWIRQHPQLDGIIEYYNRGMIYAPT